MSERVSIHVSAEKRAAILAGRAPIFAGLEAALAGAGWQVDWRGPGDAAEPRHITYNAPPLGPQGLVLRRAYHEPFFRLERTNDRWDWDVARAVFDPASVGAKLGQTLRARMCRNLLGPAPPTLGGYLFAPLQGHLTRARSFQSMSPLAMLEETLHRDPRPIRATLHPREVYTPADHAALSALAARNPRFSVQSGGSMPLLRDCDLVVTQNSAVALTGYFAGKRAVLFASIDFHHIAASVPRDGLDQAFASAAGPEPAFAAYLYWFFRRHAINAEAPEAKAHLLRRMQDHGWPI